MKLISTLAIISVLAGISQADTIRGNPNRELDTASTDLRELFAEVAALREMIYMLDDDIVDLDDYDDDYDDDSSDDEFGERKLAGRELGSCSKKKKKCKRKCDKRYKNSRCHRKQGHPSSWCWRKKWDCKDDCNDKC